MGFDGKTHIGELIVNQAIAQDVLEIMEELYRSDHHRTTEWKRLCRQKQRIFL